MLKKVVKVTTTVVGSTIALIGLAWVAGVVCGTIITGEADKVYFKVGDREILNDDKKETEETEEA